MFQRSTPPDRGREAADWSLELLGQLDWHRFQALAEHVLVRAGFLPEEAWIRPDGAVALALAHSQRPQRLEAMVQCAPWLMRDIDVRVLREFHQMVLDQGAPRGIYVTPGQFHGEARAFARLKPLELMDGHDLLRTLQSMAGDERTYCLHLATGGPLPFDAPTCPACGKAMDLTDDSAAGQGQQDCDLVYKGKKRQIEGQEIDSRSLMLKKRSEVVFLKNVTTRAMTVQGKAAGNFVVNGSLHIAAGGCVSGLVTARAIQLDPGGTMEAEARILNDAGLAHLRSQPVQQIWRCSGSPRCRAVLPVRPSPAPAIPGPGLSAEILLSVPA